MFEAIKKLFGTQAGAAERAALVFALKTIKANENQVPIPPQLVPFEPLFNDVIDHLIERLYSVPAVPPATPPKS